MKLLFCVISCLVFSFPVFLNGNEGVLPPFDENLPFEEYIPHKEQTTIQYSDSLIKCAEVAGKYYGTGLILKKLEEKLPARQSEIYSIRQQYESLFQMSKRVISHFDRTFKINQINGVEKLSEGLVESLLKNETVLEGYLGGCKDDSSNNQQEIELLKKVDQEITISSQALYSKNLQSKPEQSSKNAYKTPEKISEELRENTTQEVRANAERAVQEQFFPPGTKREIITPPRVVYTPPKPVPPPDIKKPSTQKESFQYQKEDPFVPEAPWIAILVPLIFGFPLLCVGRFIQNNIIKYLFVALSTSFYLMSLNMLERFFLHDIAKLYPTVYSIGFGIMVGMGIWVMYKLVKIKKKPKMPPEAEKLLAIQEKMNSDKEENAQVFKPKMEIVQPHSVETPKKPLPWKIVLQIVLTIAACVLTFALVVDGKSDKEIIALITWFIWAALNFFIHISKKTHMNKTKKLVSIIAIWSVPLTAFISLILFYDSRWESLSPFALLAYGLTWFIYYICIKTKVYLSDNQNDNI